MRFRSIVILLMWAAIARAEPEKMLPLPAPSASHDLGTAVSYMFAAADSAFPGGRPLTLQLWYPASAHGKGAPYLVDKGLDRALVDNGYYGVDSTTLKAWSRLTTHSTLGAAPAY